jgi:hypothetical protein
MMKKLIVVFTLILIFLAVALVTVILTFNVPADEIGLELAKTLLQAIVVIFAGQILSFVVEKFNRDRQEAITLNDYRKSFLERITAIYIQSQKVRDQLRFEGLVSVPNDQGETVRQVRVKPYANQMDAVNEIEFDLRSLKHEITTFSYAFSESKLLITNIDIMTEILKKALKECRSNLPSKYDESTSLLLSDLPNLSDLLGPYDESTWAKEYGQRFNSILNLVRKDILDSKKRTNV